MAGENTIFDTVPRGPARGARCVAIDRALVVKGLRYDPFGNAAVSAAVILRGPQVAFTTGCYAGSPVGRDAPTDFGIGLPRSRNLKDLFPRLLPPIFLTRWCAPTNGNDEIKSPVHGG